MGKDVDLKHNTGAVTRPAPTNPGQGADINEVTFAGKALTYEADIPTQFRAGAKKQTQAHLQKAGNHPGNALAVQARHTIAPKPPRQIAKIEQASIASGVRQLDKPRRSLGRIVQRRVGWNATPTQIMVTTAERELAKRPDGRLAAAGDWLIEHRKTYTNTLGAALKRKGTIPATDQAPQPASAAPGNPTAFASPAAAGAGDEAFPEGRFALSLLPAQVRSSVISRVRNPTLFDGAVVLVSDAATGEERHKEVNVIRMDDTKAVVVQATLKPDMGQWEVSQASYSLSAPEIEQV